MRVWDRLTSRAGYWEGLASGAAVLTSTYGAPDREQVLPQFAAAAQNANASNGVAFAAILARIMLLSQVEFKFQRLRDKSLFGDQRLQMLDRPWPGGNAFIWDAGDQLVRWRPEWVTIVSQITRGPRGPYREVVGYHYEPPKNEQPAYGEPQDAAAAEVAHWAPIPDPC